MAVQSLDMSAAMPAVSARPTLLDQLDIMIVRDGPVDTKAAKFEDEAESISVTVTVTFSLSASFQK